MPNPSVKTIVGLVVGVAVFLFAKRSYEQQQKEENPRLLSTSSKQKLISK